MKNLLKSVIVLAFCFTFISVSAKDEKKKDKEVIYKVEMDCQSCVNKISKNMAFEKGVKALDVDFEKQTVSIKYKEGKTNNENLVAAFKKLGFEATELKEGACADKKEHKCSGEHDHKH